MSQTRDNIRLDFRPSCDTLLGVYVNADFDGSPVGISKRIRDEFR